MVGAELNERTGHARGVRPGAATAPRDVLVFRLADQQYGIPVGEVQEIVPMARLVRSASLPAVIDGFLNLAGRAVAVVPLRRLLGLPDRPAGVAHPAARPPPRRPPAGPGGRSRGPHRPAGPGRRPPGPRGPLVQRGGGRGGDGPTGRFFYCCRPTACCSTRNSNSWPSSRTGSRPGWERWRGRSRDRFPPPGRPRVPAVEGPRHPGYRSGRTTPTRTRTWPRTSPGGWPPGGCGTATPISGC